MQARSMAAMRGWSWIVEGFQLFIKNPALLTFLVFGYWLMLISINLVPFLGMVAAPVCVPAFSVSVMEGCRAIAEGRTAGFNLLFSGFQRNAKSLLILGALYFVASIAVLGVTFWIDGGKLLEIMVTGRTSEPENLGDPRLVLALQVGLLLTVPLFMAFWFSPLLVAWQDLPPLKSLFFSFVASWRNWRPFLIYGAGVAFISAILPGIVLAIAALISEGAVRILAMGLGLPMLFVFLPTLFGSFYTSYRDVFGEPPSRAGPA